MKNSTKVFHIIKEVSYVLIILFLLYILISERWPGITYVEYSFEGPFGTRSIDWCYVDFKVTFDNDVFKVHNLIQDKTGRKKVVMRNIIVLKRHPFKEVERRVE